MYTWLPSGARDLIFGMSLNLMYNLCTQEVKALANLHKCADSLEPSLLTDAISTKILCAYSVNDIFAVFKIQYGHSKIDKTKILLTNGSFMKVESIAEC